jgi:membrane protease YdiL (CAAX protease family)
VALGLIPARAVSYAARLGVVGLALGWSWRSWPPLRGPGRAVTSAAVGVVAGLVGAAAWGLLLWPPRGHAAAAAWTPLAAGLRLAAASLLVPLVEELWCRGYLLRVALQWDEARRGKATDPLRVALDERDLRDVAPGAWSVAAVAASTLLFALGHAPAEYLAAVVYGLLMAGLWIARGDLLTCVVAHGVSNAALGGWVVSQRAWGLW